MIRSIVQDKVKPARLIFRPEVLDQVIESAEKYGFGSPFCTKKYLEKRIFDLVIEKKTIEYHRGIFKKAKIKVSRKQERKFIIKEVENER